MKPVVLVPFKAHSAKSRLSKVLGNRQRASLASEMLLHVLSAVRSAGLLGRCYVVSSRPSVLRLAAMAGASTIREADDAGVNSAVERGMASLAEANEFLVVPSDLPLLSAHDLEAALALRSGGMDIVISPSRTFNGTNLLLFSRSRGVRLSYDRDSFKNHLGEAGNMKLRTGVYCGPGVVFDVDSPSDLKELVRPGRRRRPSEMARKRVKWAS
ncbi:MAG: 2-phospho-L-lactate guanylyltransferase [Thaumarchaeota archaeon]|nr:2-phospho-L-lactate guanylyltransferase [Nitrososphaerota archaeon]